VAPSTDRGPLQEPVADGEAAERTSEINAQVGRDLAPCEPADGRAGRRWLGSTTIRHFSANSYTAAGDLRRIRF
jgi:hypothetical protein